MGRMRKWADSVVRICSDVSERFFKEYKSSGLSFGEFCETLLGAGTTEGRLLSELRVKEQELYMLDDKRAMTIAHIAALKDAIAAERESFDSQIRAATEES